MIVRVIYRRRALARDASPKLKASWITVGIAGAITFTCVGYQHPGPLRAAAATSPPANGLAFRLERRDRDVWLSWNRESGIVAGATSGMLSIRQGSAERTIALTHDELREARIFCPDATDQTSFRLRVFGINGTIAEESVTMNAMHPATPAKLE